MERKKTGLSRRAFLGGVAATAAFTIVPRYVLGGAPGRAPSDKINIAGIGVGGQGHGDVREVSGGNNIVALCDVDEQKAGGIFKEFPDARKFRDFRKMFDAMGKGIDAVVIATPDHTHAVVAMAAIQRGKHVYCEKPLAHSVAEVRALTKAAADRRVITQLGNQGHSSESIRMFCEWIWDGAIGKVQRIDCGCSAVNSGIDALGQIKQTPPVPATLDWDLWLGPAQERPYSPAYHPYNWRGWVPFGNGTIGDWTCHVIDPVFWALDLGSPTTVQAQVKDYDPKTQGDAFPKGDVITYEFPAKGARGAIPMVWYSGTEKIPRPKELTGDTKHYDTGAVVYGDKGVIHYGSHGAGGVRIIPEEQMKAYKTPPQKIPRVRGHHADWVAAIREGRKAGSDFSYGGPLTEIAMLGVIAIRLAPAKLQWDTRKMRFTNSPEANALINPPYRKGWKL
ncbi:MAG: Gfo/Idh/MocA family oxidoreductase [Acidobacteria bacterium]|nr:Gfo/Idh/MocA family oxidoreductase [Acidobacteriota bacterium]